MSVIEIKPLLSLDEVIHWENSKCPIDCRIPKISRLVEKNRPKILICHDMMGGYLEDKWINMSSASDSYTFFMWSKIDIFVYFSHHFLTIPPHGWIVTGHRHGVEVLGTIITEWDSGKQICQELLESEAKVDEFCFCLCEIAKYYGFDGWLINIENEIELSKIPTLLYFVSKLTKEMKKAIDGSKVIWYDSVLTTGELKWQDELNDLNRDFFDACDGIFLNYNWNEAKLKKSRELAGERQLSLFVGVDVFGRGDCQKEGFECKSVIEKVTSAQMSIAIFANGWIYETLGKETFIANECRFWNCIGNLLPSIPYSCLPLVTSFCNGSGKRMYRFGKEISLEPWHCLAFQQLQPSFHETEIQFEHCSNDAVFGGGCLKVSATLGSETEKTENLFCDFPIFVTHIPVKSKCIVSYTYKILCKESVSLALVFDLYKNKKIIFASEEFVKQSENEKFVYPTKPEKLLHQFEWEAREEQNGWIKRMYLYTPEDGALLTGIAFRISSCLPKKMCTISVLLGQVIIIPEEDLNKHCTSKKPIEAGYRLNEINGMWQLEWNIKAGPTQIFDVFCGEEKYVGSTAQNYFNVASIKDDGKHFFVLPASML